MDRVQKAAVAVACLVLSVLLLALSIDAVGEVPTLRELHAPDLPGIPDLPFQPNPDTTSLDQMTGEDTSNPLLRIFGATETSYLRMVPYDKYYSGTWETALGSSAPYLGGYVDLPVETLLSVDPVSFTVYPLSDLGQYLPTAPNTVSMNLTDMVDYIFEGQVFSSDAEPQAYSLTYLKFVFSEDQLRDASVVYLPEYLEVPDYLEEELQALAEEITAGDSTPYDQLVSLRDYLVEHYEYNMSYPSPPQGVDPLEFFLFESGEGVCIQFNTALTMMARTLNISSRLVGGFYIDPDALVQDVYPIQRHAFTEVPFEGLGWVIFDATPGSDISSIIDSLPEVNVTDGDAGNGTSTGAADKPLDVIGPPSDAELFRIYGATGTRYLRDGAADYYNGSWYVSGDTALNYSGYYIERVVDGYERVDGSHFYVEYGEPVGGFIPSPLYTLQLISEATLIYYPELELFEASKGNVTVYEVVSETPFFNEASLAEAEPYVKEAYLQIPEALNSTIRPIALQASRNQAGAYGKVRALERFLMTQYAYNLTRRQAPLGVDPVEWFLIREKQGVCTDFNSALVLLARSLGIPSRLVTGYLINPEAETQVVGASQAHAYAEVLFDGLGWVAFDATPTEVGEAPAGDGRIPTYTNVTQQDEYVLVGSRFTVAGTVEDDAGYPVSGLSILVYLKRDKSEAGVLAGKTLVQEGRFNASCLFPAGVPPGQYMVDVHALGNDSYLGSWSDPPIVGYTETMFLVESPEKVVAGKMFELSGTLLDKPTNKTIGAAPCTVEVDGRMLRGATDGNGRVVFEVSLDQPGEYPVRYSWDGAGYYLGASAVETIRSLPLEFTLTDTTLVRGETSVISGVVHADDIPGAREAITVSITGVEVSTIADESGGFTLTYRAPQGLELGTLPIELTLHSSQLAVTHTLNVHARPSLSVATGGTIQAGERRQATLLLVDDHEAPLPGMAVEAEYHVGEEARSFDLVTGQGGEAVFELFAESEEPGTLSYEARFLGAGHYVAAVAVGSLTITPAPGFPIYQVIAVLLAALGLGGLLVLRRRWKKPNASEAPVSVAEPEMPKGLSIRFPEIASHLPDVWGVGEDLGVLVKLTTPEGEPVKDASVKLAVKDKVEWLQTEAEGETQAHLSLPEKGLYEVTADYAAGKLHASRPIRVVEYRDEIIDLFNAKFKEAGRRFKALRDNHTAREIMEHLKKETPAQAHGAIGEMVFLFEEANYSLHPVQRGLYERFYKAMTDFEEASRSE